MNFFRKILYKKKRKRPFILIEAVIAILLISIVGFTFFEIERKIARKVQDFCIKTESEREKESAYALLLEKLSRKEISSDVIERGKTLTFKHPREPWSSNFHFINADDDKSSVPKAFLIKVEITLSHPNLQLQNPPFEFYFCWNKDEIITKSDDKKLAEGRDDEEE